MQGHSVDVGRWAAGGAGSGRVELGRVLRLLTAMLLLGVALLVVALLGQGVAAARPLTATPDAAGNAAPHAGGRPEGVLPPAGSMAVPAPHAAGLDADPGARDDLARSLVAATDVLTRQAVPSPAAAARSPGGSKAPERPGRGSVQLAANANWGYAKQPDEVRVADQPRLSAQPTAPKVAEVVGPVIHYADRLGKWLGNWQGTEVAALVAENRVTEHAKEATKHAYAADRLAPGASIHEASVQALRAVGDAGGELRPVAEVAHEVAKKLDKGSMDLRAGARAAEEKAGTAEGQLAAPPELRPTFEKVLSPVLGEALELSTLTSGTMTRLAFERAQANKATAMAGVLAESVTTNAEAGDGRGSIGKLRELIALTDKLADSLGQEGKDLRGAAQAAQDHADGALRAAPNPRGTQPAAPQKGTEAPQQPSDTPPVQHAGAGEPESGAGAAVQVQAAPAPAAGGGDLELAAGPAEARALVDPPAGVPDGDPFDNSPQVADGESGLDAGSSSTAPESVEVMAADSGGGDSTEADGGPASFGDDLLAGLGDTTFAGVG
jgi:hypothetical protein